MVKHIVIWNLKEDGDGRTKEENFQRIRKDAKALLGQVEGLLAIDVFQGYQGWDVALVADMADKNAERAYQVNPQHMALKEMMGRIAKDRALIDFEF